MKLTMNDMPPKPKWLGNFGAPHTRDTYGGVVVDYWGNDEEILKHLTPEDIININGMPGKSGALFHVNQESVRVLFHFNVEDDPMGKYMLWDITGDLETARKEPKSPGGLYFGMLCSVITRMAREMLGQEVQFPAHGRN